MVGVVEAVLVDARAANSALLPIMTSNDIKKR